ncbi:MAG: metallophosphoesterase family protein [Deltaproteobacteria bacterium]
MSLKNLLLTFAALLVSSCMANPVVSESGNLKAANPRSALKVWALSDIQPKNQAQKLEFTRAVADINRNVPDIDLAIVAGDLIEDAREEDFDWYLSEKSRSYIEEWYEIAGNHDLKLERGAVYREKINPEFYYSILKGNALFIFMSDEVRGKPTEISDETFRWWKSLVAANQDKIIVVITHAPLEGSGIPFSSGRERQIADSGRFAEVMKSHRVDVWLSGHLHLPHALANNISIKAEFGGAAFVNVSSIRTELWGIKDSESRVLTFTCGSDALSIEARNHAKGQFEPKNGATVRLSKKYDCGGT